MMTNDGQSLKASSPEEVLEELRSLSRSPSRDARDFMEQTRTRMLALGRSIRTSSPEVFVADLLEVGLLMED